MPTLAKGTYLYHGTRLGKDGEKWWEKVGNFPNKVGEDGGVSYCLDESSSPKIKNAQQILRYITIQDLPYTVCTSKADFYNTFRDNVNVLACWTKTENELSIRLVVQGAYLQYSPTAAIPGCIMM